MSRAGEPAPALERDWVLAVDLGNGRAKWTGWRLPFRVHDAPVLRLVHATDARSDDAALRAELAELGFEAPARAGIASVAAPELEQELARALTDLGCAEVLLELDHGLDVRCRKVHTIGADRLFAAAGAAAWLGRSCVVLDAGTALTVDAVHVPDDGPPRFLGGAIAPGPELLAESLARSGARLFRVEPAPGAPALGTESAEALQAGCSVGFRGAAFELARRVGLEAGLAAAPRVLCGGAAAFLLEPEPFWPGELVHEPDLVARGIAAALERAGR